MRDFEAYLVYHINEGLGCVPVETTDHLDFIPSGDNILDERDEFVRREGTGS